MDKHIGLKIRELRKERGLSQQDLADNIGISRSTVSGYEQQTSQPDLETLRKLALLFNVSSDYLLGIENENIPSEEFMQKLVYYGRKLNITNRDIIIGDMAAMIKEQKLETSTKRKEIG